MDNLDQQWIEAHPPTAPELRTFTFQGKTLVRLEETPLVAFKLIETYPNDFMRLVQAIRLCLDPVCWTAFNELVPDDPPEDTDTEFAALTAGKLTVPRAGQLWQYLLVQGSGRPTLPQSGSSGTAQPNGTPSTVTPVTAEEWTSGASVPGASSTSPTPSP